MNNDRTEFLAARRSGIGGSDVAALLGISPWRSPLDLYLDKTGSGEAQPESEPMYWGNVLEHVVAAEFSRRTGKRVQRVNTLLRDQQRPWMLANIDRALVADGSRARVADDGKLAGAAGILECKTANAFAARDWQGEDGSDALPVYYAAQGMWYLAVTGQDVCEFAALIGGQQFVLRRVERDDETIRALIERAHEFWHRHVLAGVPPEPRSAEDALKLWRRDSGELLPIDDARPLQVALSEYRSLRAQAKDLDAQLDGLADEIKLAIGGASGLSIGGTPVCTWKASKDSAVVNWQAIAHDLAAIAGADHLPGAIARHTATKPGSRRFLLKD